MSPVTVASSSGSPGLAALELGLFCKPLSQTLQKDSLKWEPGVAGGVREKEKLIVFDISGKLWADQGVMGCEWDPLCLGDFCSLP